MPWYHNDDACWYIADNGASINYYYDNLDRIVSLRYNNNEQTAFNYTYNRFGSVSAITDTASGIAKIYDYDTVGRLISARTENGTNDVFRTHYTYDGLSRLDTLKYVYSTSAGTRYTHEYSATYGEDSRVNTFGLNGIFSITPTFDGLGRQSSRVLKNGSGAQVEKEAYTFTAGAGGANATTTLIDSVTYYGAGTTGTQYSYEYDKSGNLTKIKKGTATLHTYTYDSLGQLTSWYNAATDKTVRYGYYKGGNLKNIYDGEDTVSFVYNNGDGIADRLMVYDGQLLSYDDIGNPLNFRDGISMTWKNGRQLATLTNGQTSASYDYDESGIRTKKTVNGVTTTFQLDGSKIVSENRNGTVQSYFYDENGSVLGITYGGENYYFRKNFRNDVLAILNASGEVVVEYSYDPWGNILAVNGSLASTLGSDNPFRYRGYYYDTESCFYYLNSRYYDAKVCRFVNADSYVSTGQGLLGHNMYAYCLNSPTNYQDSTGGIAITTIILIGSIIAGVAAATYTAVSSYEETGEVDIISTAVSGFSVFAFFYTAGLSIYGFYVDYCYYRGYTPVTEIGPQQNSYTNLQNHPYANLQDPPNVGAGKDFTAKQKENIIEQNRKNNNGTVRSDLSGIELVPPQKSSRGITPSPNEWQIDHIVPKSQGGTNSYANAQVLSRRENRLKWYRIN